MKPLQYLSPEWTQELRARLQQEITPAKGNATASIVFRHLNVPGGGERYLYFNITNGMLRALESGEGAGPQAEFVISGDYQAFAQVLKGQIDPARALKSGRLRLQGNMMRALRLLPLIEKIIFEASDIPTTF